MRRYHHISHMYSSYPPNACSQVGSARTPHTLPLCCASVAARSAPYAFCVAAMRVRHAFVAATRVRPCLSADPHIDMRDTGARACQLLEGLLRQRGSPLHRAWRAVDFLIPLTAQYHDADPARALCQAVLQAASGGRVLSADFAPGFPASDGAACRPALVCYGLDAAEVIAAADALLAAVVASEPFWANSLLEPDVAVAEAMRELRSETHVEGNHGPVVIADAQDNPGAGGSSDSVGLLESMVRAGAAGVVCIVHDPMAATAAHEARVGGRFAAGLGGRCIGHRPFDGQFDVLHVNDGNVQCTGEMYRGILSRMGPSALLRVVGTEVRVIVSSVRTQPLDCAYLRHVGVEPENESLLVLKSSGKPHQRFLSVEGLPQSETCHHSDLVAGPANGAQCTFAPTLDRWHGEF